MKGTEAVIKVFVPGFQIGQNVTVYFPDTMIKKGVCEENPVVRCKDCKHGEKTENAYRKEETYCNRIKTSGYHADNWFCADGERKDS